MNKTSMISRTSKVKVYGYTKSGLCLKGLQLPNVERFEIIQRSIDKLLEYLGYRKVFWRLFRVTRLGTLEANKYIKWHLSLLHRYAKQGKQKEFRSLSNRLMKNSAAFAALHLNRVNPRWYEEYSIMELKRTMKRVFILNALSSSKFQYKRIFIPKPDGSQRPLAVPTLPWRILSNWHYTLMWIWVEGRGGLAKNQYGSYPGRSVKDAWYQAIQDSNKRNIFEFDLKKFFDSIDWEKIKESLNSINYPLTDWSMRFIEFGQNYIGLSRIAEAVDLHKSLGNNETATDLHRLLLKLKDLTNDKYHNIMTSREQYNLFKIWTRTRNVRKLISHLSSSHDSLRKGVPQGSGTSPLMSVLALNPLYKKYGGKLKMYADDGYLASDEDLNIEEFKKELDSLGIKINLEKSKWIKRNGVPVSTHWKYLGVELDMFTGELRGSTRNGSKAPGLDIAGLNNLLAYGPNSLRSLAYKPWYEQMHTLGWWGFNLSKMYSQPEHKPEKLLKRKPKYSILNLVRNTHNIKQLLDEINASSLSVPVLLRLTLEARTDVKHPRFRG